MTTGGGNGAQDPNSQAGKVLRLRDDGSVPSDNPFVGKAGYRPEIYTLGHRSSLGLAMHPGTGEMWQNENGPNGGDEINILKPGAQLRLADRELRPHVSGPVAVGKRPGTKASSRRSCTGCRRSRSRAWRSTPATACRSGRATSSSARCAPARFPAPATSSASCSTRRWRSCAASRCSARLRQRIRDVRQGPDGLLYVCTDMEEGAVLRIEPVS